MRLFFPYVHSSSSHFLPLSIPDNFFESSVGDTSTPCENFETLEPETTITPNSLTSGNSCASDHSCSQSIEPVLRKSTRVTKPPSYLHDYVHHCNSVVSCACTISSICTNASLAIPVVSCHNAIQSAPPLTEPTSYEQVVLFPEWREAIAKEFSALEANNTWKLVPLPPGKKAISPKWVFKMKRHADGSIE